MKNSIALIKFFINASLSLIPLLLMLFIIAFFGIFFTIWEKRRPSEARQFWDDVYDPYF